MPHPMRSAKIFANGAERPVKAPFLAQIDFSWTIGQCKNDIVT